MGQGVVEQMLYQKWVLISRLNETAGHASPHPKRTLKHTIFLSKRIDADQRCGASWPLEGATRMATFLD